jgi:hypothetical protein
MISKILFPLFFFLHQLFLPFHPVILRYQVGVTRSQFANDFRGPNNIYQLIVHQELFFELLPLSMNPYRLTYLQYLLRLGIHLVRYQGQISRKKPTYKPCQHQYHRSIDSSKAQPAQQRLVQVWEHIHFNSTFCALQCYLPVNLVGILWLYSIRRCAYHSQRHILQILLHPITISIKYRRRLIRSATRYQPYQAVVQPRNDGRSVTSV